MSFTGRRETLITGFLRSLDSDAERIALELGDESWTYSALWRRASAIAGCLDSRLDAGDTLVALLASRSLTAYSGILGILAAGRGYVPLNPKFPIDRTRTMLAASGCNAIVVGSEGLEKLVPVLATIARRLTVILPDAANENWASQLPNHTIVLPSEVNATVGPQEPAMVDEQQPAYLLFTSGSTGVPKGVAISHANVTSYLRFISREFPLHPDDRCSQNFDLTFDLSVHDLFACWKAGATLCPFTDRYLVPAGLIDERALTVWFSVPSIALLASRLGLLEDAAFPSLRLSLFCGEALSGELAQRWQRAAPHSTLVNLYGPTETTIAISRYVWDAGTSPRECANGIVPLGWTFDGHTARVVDDDGYAVPDGAIGELCLAGSQVASGYHNDPVRTREQFVRLPGSEEISYRTGDVVRRNEHGCLHYVGRKDHQVKINGYRVELQEIEHVLREAANTGFAVALPWPLSEGTASGIVAALSGSHPGEDGRVMEQCRERLPQYMVPSRICHLDTLPLTPNGKIDRARVAEAVAMMVKD